MKGILLTYSARRAMSASLAVLLAFIVSIAFEFKNSEWLVLSAMLMCITTRGTPLRQCMLISLALVVALFVSTFLQYYLNISWLYCVLGAISFISLYLSYIYLPLNRQNFIIVILFPLLLLLMTLLPHDLALNNQRFIACIIGSLLGIGITASLAYVNFAKEFTVGISPLMQSISNYAQSLRVQLSDNQFSQDKAIKAEIETKLSAFQQTYPEWVFDIGFNPELRTGYRYFLIKLDQLMEGLFSLSYLFSENMDIELVEKLKEPINKSLEANAQLFAVISHYLNFQPMPTDKANLTDDITDLEKKLAALLPQSIELLDINTSYILLSAIVRDIKDLRELLVQLIAALPPTDATLEPGTDVARSNDG